MINSIVTACRTYLKQLVRCYSTACLLVVIRSRSVQQHWVIHQWLFWPRHFVFCCIYGTHFSQYRYVTSNTTIGGDICLQVSFATKQNAGWCLGLTERCVDVLIIIENEILEAGADVALDLKVPLAALTQCVATRRTF